MKEIDMTSEVKTINFPDKKTGERRSMRKQIGFIDMGGPYPEKVEISVEDAAQPWPEGKYLLDVESMLYLNRYGSLALGRPVLNTPAPVKSSPSLAKSMAG